MFSTQELEFALKLRSIAATAALSLTMFAAVSPAAHADTVTATTPSVASLASQLTPELSSDLITVVSGLSGTAPLSGAALSGSSDTLTLVQSLCAQGASCITAVPDAAQTMDAFDDLVNRIAPVLESENITLPAAYGFTAPVSSATLAQQLRTAQAALPVGGARTASVGCFVCLSDIAVIIAGGAAAVACTAATLGACGVALAAGAVLVTAAHSADVMNGYKCRDFAKTSINPAHTKMSAFVYTACDSPTPLVVKVRMDFIDSGSVVQTYNKNCPASTSGECTIDKFDLANAVTGHCYSVTNTWNTISLGGAVLKGEQAGSKKSGTICKTTKTDKTGALLDDIIEIPA